MVDLKQKNRCLKSAWSINQMVIPIHFDLEQRQDTSGCKLARFFLLISTFY